VAAVNIDVNNDILSLQILVYEQLKVRVTDAKNVAQAVTAGGTG